MKTVEAAYTAWSKSGIGALTTGCSWQSYLTKVVGLPDPGNPATIAGTAYHAALEHHERTRLLNVRDRAGLTMPDRGALSTVAEAALQVEAAKVPSAVWELHDTDYDATLGKVEVALSHWWEAPILDGQPGAGGSLRDRLLTMRPVAVEPYFRTRLDVSPRPLHGFVDWLGYDHDEQQWCVVDHKSSGGFGRWPHNGGGHELEASAYAVGAVVASNLPASGQVRMEWHIARTQAGKNARFEPVRVVAAEPARVEREWLEGHMLAADNIVNDRAFEKNEAWTLCAPKWCSHWVGCQVTGELSPETMLGASHG